jgi:hypothetical protein
MDVQGVDMMEIESPPPCVLSNLEYEDIEMGYDSGYEDDMLDEGVDEW